MSNKRDQTLSRVANLLHRVLEAAENVLVGATLVLGLLLDGSVGGLDTFLQADELRLELGDKDGFFGLGGTARVGFTGGVCVGEVYVSS